MIGNGGLFAKQRTAPLRTPIVPVAGRGENLTAVIGIDHFLQAMNLLVESDPLAEANLFYTPQPSSLEFVRAVRSSAGRRTHVVLLPGRLAIIAARVIQTLHLPIPVHPDQIRALLADEAAPWRSNLSELLPELSHEFTLQHALAALNNSSIG